MPINLPRSAQPWLAENCSLTLQDEEEYTRPAGVVLSARAEEDELAALQDDRQSEPEVANIGLDTLQSEAPPAEVKLPHILCN